MRLCFSHCFVSLLAMLSLVGCEPPPGEEYTYYYLTPTEAGAEPAPMKIQVAKPVADSEPLSNGLYPGVLYIHGGSWESGSKQGMYDDMRAAIAKGYVAASLNYRLSIASDFNEYGVWPAPLEDVKCAIRWMRANATDTEKGWKLDPDRIAVVGLSAGGHLALLAGETSGLLVDGVPAFETSDCNFEGADGETSEVAAVATMSGIGDLNQLWERSETNARNGFLISKVEQMMGGVDLSGEGPHEAVQELNPINYVSDKGPAVMMVHPENDSVVSPKAEAKFPNQADSAALGYHETLQSMGRNSMFVMPDRGGHYTEKGSRSYAREEILLWMDLQLKGINAELACGSEAACQVVLPQLDPAAANGG